MTIEHLESKIIPLYTRNKWVQRRYPEEPVPVGLSLTVEEDRRVYRWRDKDEVLVVEN